MITVVNYGIGNLGSILNMFRRIGVAAAVSSDPAAIGMASKLVLPGVGAFDAAMSRLNASGLRPLLDELVLERGLPVIGLCLGMQLLTCGSEEGALPGLGWIEGETRRFRFPEGIDRLKIPHMGWNSLKPVPGKPLTENLGHDARFYFVHSYHVMLSSPDDAAGWTHYGYDFVSVVQKRNIMGAQFHPEKSHRHGMGLLRTFAELPPC